MDHPTNKNAVFQEEYFKTRFTYDPRRDIVWKEVARYIQEKHIPQDSRVLDLGAGYCDFINNINARERYAMDIFSQLSDHAAEGVTALNADCTDLSYFSDDSLDVVFASNLFEHLTREELFATTAEIKRVLHSDGRLILLQPNFKYCFKTYFDDFTHLQIFTDNGMIDFLEVSGLKIEKMYAKFIPVNMKSTLKLELPRLDYLVRLYLNFPIKPLAGQMLVVAQNSPP